MERRIDAHWDLIGVLAGDGLLHVEKIAVALLDRRSAQSSAAIRTTEVSTEPAWTDTTTLVTRFFRRTCGDVARGKIPETRVLALQEVIALGFGNRIRGPSIAFLLRHPNAA